MSIVKLVGESGMSNDLKIYIDGKQVDNVTEIIIDPIRPNAFIEARIKFCSMELDIQAHLLEDEFNEGSDYQ